VIEDNKKREKTITLLKEIAGNFIRFEVDPKYMVTVHNVNVSDSGRKVKYGISVFPKDKEKETLTLLSKKRGEMKKYMKEKTRLGILPHITFEADKSWELEMRIDELLK